MRFIDWQTTTNPHMTSIVKLVTNIRNNRRSVEVQNRYDINNGNEPSIKQKKKDYSSE